MTTLRKRATAVARDNGEPRHDGDNKDPRLCLVPGCDELVRCRGLCTACYRRAQVMTSLDIVTWEELIELGLALPAMHRTQTSRFTIELERARARRKLAAAMAAASEANGARPENAG